MTIATNFLWQLFAMCPLTSLALGIILTNLRASTEKVGVVRPAEG
jgi:hypothetical protein